MLKMAFLAADSIRGAHTGRTYTVVRALGHGAFGEVLLVEDEQSGHQYAAKQLYLRDRTEQLPLPVHREMTALHQLQHSNVVALVDTSEDGPCFYLVQELCKTDVAAVLAAANRHLPPAVVKSITQQLLQALATCHACDLMHRDVKPSNLLMTADGVLKLGDFGLARKFGALQQPSAPDLQKSQQAGVACHQHGQQPLQDVHQGKLLQQLAQDCGSKLYNTSQRDVRQPSVGSVSAACFTAAQGTRWYRAPELLFGARDYGPAVDIWAAGMVFAELLSLSPLIPGQSDIDQLARMQQTLGSITSQEWPEVEHLPDWHKIRFGHSPGQQLSDLLPDAPAAALDLLQCMICYNPSKRLTAAGALQHRYFTSELPAAAGNEIVAAVVKELMQQVVPAMPQCQASFTWSDIAGSDSELDLGGSSDEDA